MLPRASQLDSFTDVFGEDYAQENNSQPISLPSSYDSIPESPTKVLTTNNVKINRPSKHTGQHGEFRSVEEIDPKYKCLFTYPFFNVVQSRIIEDALYSDKSLVLCAPTGSGKTVAFELAILQLLMQIEDMQYTGDFKIIYMAPVKAVCNERLTEWYPKLTKLGLLCIEVTGDTEVDFTQLKPYKVIITTPEKWDMLTRRWRDHRGLVEMIKLFLIDEVHILNDETRGPVLEAVVSRMKTIESAAQSAHRIEQLQKQYQGVEGTSERPPPRIRFVAVSATVSNPEDVADWLGTSEKPAVFHKFGDECRPVKLRRIVEGYPCADGTSIFKFDLILNYKLWPIIQKYHNGKPTLIFCNTRKSVALTAETLSREITVGFNPEQKAVLSALASTLKNKKLQMLVMSGVGCHHAGLLYEERVNIEQAFRNLHLPILITTTTLAMGVNLPAHLVIIKNTQQYVNGAYQEYSISTVLQMVGRAGRPQFDTEATAVIMTRLNDKARYQSLVGGSEPLQSYLHKRIAENLNSEAALGTVTDVAQCVEWLRSTFLYVRAAKDPKRYLGLPPAAPMQLILKKIEELCVKAMNGLASSGLITMDEACCIESTEAGRLMSIFYLDVETMKNIMKIEGTESLDRLLWLICESHELSDMHLRMDERRCLNLLNRNNAAATIRFPMKGKISTRQMKLSCIIQAILGCLPIPEPSLNQEAMKVMKIASRVCSCLVKYVTRPDLVSQQPQYFSAVLNSIVLAKCIDAHMWENSPYVSKQMRGIGPTFSTLLASAGITSFMLLEESHPRDLERIMNKGPPAGNVLRKQVSLLPKYQLTTTPIDSQSIRVQLMLLNHNHLSENMDHLTAGDSHKSYLIVGDSENHLLLLKPFSDKDLISVYDGVMNFEITRKQNNEHTIMIHCISSSIVGIDAHAEYSFQDLEPPTRCEDDNVFCPDRDPAKTNTTRKQTHMTDVYKQRKRNNNSQLDITHSKEKIKRENALTEKLKVLKECFGKTSREHKKDTEKSTKMSNNVLNELLENRGPPNCSRETHNMQKAEVDCPTVDLTNIMLTTPWEEITINEDDDDYIDDLQIDSILNKIETEITGKHCSNKQAVDSISAIKKDNICDPSNVKVNNMPKALFEPSCSGLVKDSRKRRNIHTKSNFSVIDLIEKKAKTDDTHEVPTDKSTSTFSDTIKLQINKFLGRAQVSNLSSPGINELIYVTEDELPAVHVKNQQTAPNNMDALVMHDLQPNPNKTSVFNNGSQMTVINKLDSSTAPHIHSENESICANDDKSDVYKRENVSEVDVDNATDAKGINDEINCMDNTSIASVKPYVWNNKLRDNCTENIIERVNIPTKKSLLPHQCSPTVERLETLTNKNLIPQPCKPENLQLITENDYELPSDKTESVVEFVHNEDKAITNAKDTSSRICNMEKALIPFGKQQDRKNKVAVKYIKSNADRIDTSLNKSLVPYSDFKSSVVPYQCKLETVQRNVENNYKMIADLDKRSEKSESEEELAQNEDNVIKNIDMNDHKYHMERALQPFGKPCAREKDVTVNGLKHKFEQGINTNNCLTPSLCDLQAIQNNVENDSKAFLNNNKCISYSENDMVKQLNTCSDSRKYFPCFDDKKTHVNKYSYSATKVDVCTKNTPDHLLRITRKLKVDVDITEVITQEETKINKVNPQKENKVVAQNNINDENTKSLTGNKRELTFQENFQKCTQHLDHEDKKQEWPCNEEKSVNSTTTNSVANILQKYSRILVKPQTPTQTIISHNNNKINDPNSKPSRKTTEQQTSMVKSRRPFRIRDIHTMDAPLPIAIAEASRPAQDASQTKRFQECEEVKICSEDRSTSQDVILPQHEHNLNNEQSDNNERSPSPYESPISVHSIIDLDPVESIKDENMFNPKMLLQYFNTDSNDVTEIIPPPSQFVDENPSAYSPTLPIQPYETYDLYKNCNLDSQYTRTDEDDSVNNFNSHLDTGSCSLRLSPKEIETWTLSRDDQNDTYRSQPISSAPWHISQRVPSSQVHAGLKSSNLDSFNSHLDTGSCSLRLSPKEKGTWTLSRDDQNDTYKSQPISSAPWHISQRAGSSQVHAGLRSSRGLLSQFKFVRKKQLRP